MRFFGTLSINGTVLGQHDLDQVLQGNNFGRPQGFCVDRETELQYNQKMFCGIVLFN